MPYINKHDRAKFYNLDSDPMDVPTAPETVGELTYLITRTVQRYLTEHGITYSTQAQVLGALEGAKADFIRRVLNPYEATKERENGDVWEGFDLGREQ